MLIYMLQNNNCYINIVLDKIMNVIALGINEKPDFFV